MNISFVSDSIYPYHKGGKEKRLFEISTRLAAQGHNVHIYTMHWWPEAAPVHYEHGVHLHAISKYHQMYKGDRRSIREGILFGLACLKLLRAKFDVLDVDHMPFFPVYSCWLVCVLRGKQLYGTWHEALSLHDWTSYMGKAGYIAALIERISIRLPHTVTAASQHTHGLISQQLHRQKRVRMVASGIDTTGIAAIRPAAVKCDVLYAGRLVKDKHVDVLVDAIAAISRIDPLVQCVIIGHGIERDAIASQIKRLQVGAQVRLLDPLPEANDVYAYMKAAKVFCLPSVREGFGIVALEALACGTPVVTVDSPSNAAKDLIADGQNGSVVPLDAEVLAKVLSIWIKRKPETDPANAVQSYDWNNLARAQAEVYNA